ncbi:MAG: 4Fe-4S binding protein [Planctomycetota bacterium]
MIRHGRNATQVGAMALLLAVPLAAGQYAFTGVTGWYQSLDVFGLAFLSPVEGLESLLLTGSIWVPLLWALLPTLLVVLLLGRVFCSWVCPVNLLQEMTDRSMCRPRARPDHVTLPRSTILWVLAAELAAALAAGVPLFCFWSPPALVGREIFMAVFFRTVAIEGALIVVILLLNLFTARFFCRHLCPLGGMLALLGRWRRLRVRHAPDRCTACGQCDPVCPMGIRPAAGESQSMWCWNCGECVDACGDSALSFTVKK